MLLCATVASAHDFAVNDIYYNIISDGAVEVSFRGEAFNDYTNEYSGKVAIPSSVTYGGRTYRVTRIGQTAFWKCSSLTGVTIPTSVTDIHASAFGYCTGLSSVVIPNSVISIGYGAFQYCSNLKSVTLSNRLITIEDYAFQYCSSLTSIDIPSSVESIGNGAFYICSSLANINLSDKVISLGSAFYGTAWYNSQPDGVLYLGKCLYGYKGTMPSNTSIVVKDGTLFIADQAFYAVGTGLSSIEIPNSVISIGGGAFYNCTNLRSVTIPNSVTTIGDGAFRSCTAFTSITIPASVTKIGKDAFLGCTGLSVVHGSDLAAWCNIEFGDCESNPLYYANNLYLDGVLLQDLIIPDGVTEIKDYAFYKYTQLKSITIPSCVTSIGNEAFYGSSNLRTVFNYSNLDITASSQENGYVAYYAYVVIDETVQLVDDYYFRTVDGVHTLLYYNGKATDLTLPEDYKGESYKIGCGAFALNASLQKVIIPNCVTVIEASAFNGCSNLDRLTIGENVKSIGNAAFYGCSNLEVVINLSNIPLQRFSTGYGYAAYYATILVDKNDVKIGDFYFRTSNGEHTLLCYTGNAEELSLPKDYNGENYKIASSAFFNCTSLTKIEIPNSVTSIAYSAFQYCKNIKIVINKSDLAITKGSGVASYAEVVVDKNDVEFDGYYFRTNNGVHTLLCYWGNETELSLPDGCNGESYSIGTYAFYKCMDLKSIEIPNSVTSIGNYAFSNCSGLTSITSLIPADALFAVDSYTFYNVDKNVCTLYVPYGAKDTYSATYGWKGFANIVEIIPTDVTVTIDQYGNATYCSPYALDFSEVRGLKAYAATGYKTNSQVVTLTRVQTAEAGIGLFLNGEPGEYVVPVIESTDEHSLNMLVGTLELTTVNSTYGAMSNYKFTIADGDAAPMFYPFEDNTTFSAGKAYLQIPTAWLPATAQKSLSVRFDDGETTDIDELKGESGEVKTIYDLQGRVVENPTSGIYIINGKKVIIK